MRTFAKSAKGSIHELLQSHDLLWCAVFAHVDFQWQHAIRCRQSGRRVEYLLCETTDSVRIGVLTDCAKTQTGVNRDDAQRNEGSDRHEGFRNVHLGENRRASRRRHVVVIRLDFLRFAAFSTLQDRAQRREHRRSCGTGQRSIPGLPANGENSDASDWNSAISSEKADTVIGLGRA